MKSNKYKTVKRSKVVNDRRAKAKARSQASEANKGKEEMKTTVKAFVETVKQAVKNYIAKAKAALKAVLALVKAKTVKLANRLDKVFAASNPFIVMLYSFAITVLVINLIALVVAYLKIFTLIGLVMAILITFAMVIVLNAFIES